MSLSVIILTFNAEATLDATLTSARQVSNDIHVVDSGSTDSTLAIAERHGAHIVSHPFEDYGRQRNWAIDTLPLKHGWQLHLDADERLSPELSARISALRSIGVRLARVTRPAGLRASRRSSWGRGMAR